MSRQADKPSWAEAHTLPTKANENGGWHHAWPRARQNGSAGVAYGLGAVLALAYGQKASTGVSRGLRGGWVLPHGVDAQFRGSASADNFQPRFALGLLAYRLKGLKALTKSANSTALCD